MTLTSMLAENRAQLKADGLRILERAGAERRDLNAAESAAFEKIKADLASTTGAEGWAAQRQSDRDIFEAATRQLADKPIDNRTGYKPSRTVDAELNKRFRDVIHNRSAAPIDVEPDEYRSGFQPGIEMRDTYTSSGGGLLGVSFYGTMQRHLVENSAILAAGATVLTGASGEPLKVPKSTVNSTAAIVTEGSAIGESDPTLGTATLGAFKYGVLVQISTELAQDQTFDVAGYLAAQAGTALANGAGAHFITGVGTTQPLGITASTTLGVTSATGVTGAPTADNLIDLYHSVAAPYARSTSAAWLMRNSTLAVVRKLKDSQNRYLFDINAPLGSGADGTLLGRPVFVDPNMPAIGLNNKSIVFGDISKYWVRQVGGVRFEQSLDFAFANDLITFRALWRADGVLVDQTGACKHFIGAAT